MSDLSLEACLKAVEDVFEKEAELIVRGDITEIGELARVKADQLNELSNAIESGGLRGQPEAIISRVQHLQVVAVEHDRHLQAMRHGLSRMLDRIDRLRNDASVGSYNEYGAKVQFSDARGGYESKA